LIKILLYLSFLNAAEMPPDPTCPADMTVCVNDAPFVLTGGDPSGGTYSGAGVSGAVPNQIFTPSSAGVGEHVITYTEDGSCQFTISVRALPNVTCPANFTACVETSPITLTGGSPGGGTYSGTGVSSGSFDPGAAGSGVHILSYTVKHPITNCLNTCTFTATVYTICPANQSVCINTAPYALTGGLPAGGTYSGTGVTDGEFSPATAGAGVHTITYTHSDCTTTCTFDITVNALPAVTCPSYSPICHLTPTFGLAGGSPAGGTYSGTGVSNNTFNSTASGAGLHTITYSYTSPSTGCTNSCTFTINVLSLPTGVITSGSTAICIGDSTTILFTLSGTASFDVTWSDGFVQNGLNAGANSRTVSPTTIRGYSITNITDANGCFNSGSGSVTITVHPLPTVTQANMSVYKYSAPFALTGGLPSSGATYSGVGVTANTFYPLTAGVGTHEITKSYTNPSTGCSNQTLFYITVKPPPGLYPYFFKP
jgi:hypothetical protein